MDLSGETVLVTGAASGIGREVARRCLAAGARVAAIDLDEAGLARLARDSDVAALATYQCDVTDGAAAQRTVADIVERWSRLDSVVTCAGTSIGKRLADTAEDEWDRVFAVNAKGTYLWFKAAIPAMLERGGGSLVAIASMLGLIGGRNNAAYIASKGAVLSMVKSVALDYAEAGIRANAILPSATDTPMFRRFCERTPDPAATFERASKRQPLGRIAKPEEIAAAALFLASSEASFITGTALPVDGGSALGSS